MLLNTLLDEMVVDHVSPHAAGGASDLDNYLPAHRQCNHGKWDRPPEERDWNLKIGTWMAREIERQAPIAVLVASAYHAYRTAQSRRSRKAVTKVEGRSDVQLGIWLCTQIADRKRIGRLAAAEYVQHLHRDSSGS